MRLLWAPDYSAIVWAEHRSGTSYFSTLVGDVLRMVEERLNGPLARIRMTEEQTIVLDGPEYPIALYRRRDGQVIAIAYSPLQIYLQGEILFQEEFTSEIETRTCEVNQGIFYANVLPTGVQVKHFDYETLTATVVDHLPLSGAQMVCLDGTGIILYWNKKFKYYRYGGDRTGQALSPKIKFTNVLHQAFAYPHLALLYAKQYVCWNLESGERVLNVTKRGSEFLDVDWYLNQSLLLLTEKDSHQVIDLATQQILRTYQFPAPGISYPYQRDGDFYLYQRDGDFYLIVKHNDLRYTLFH